MCLRKTLPDLDYPHHTKPLSIHLYEKSLNIAFSLQYDRVLDLRVADMEILTLHLSSGSVLMLTTIIGPQSVT